MRGWQATFLLLCVTAVWGLTFVVVRDAVAAYGVLGFLVFRFAVAALAVVLIWGKRIDLDALKTGAGIGLVLAVGFLFQTWGLRYTTATNSGLITGLFVVLAPVADRVLYGTRLRWLAWIAVGMSFAGMALLTGGGAQPFNIGDALTFVCAVAFGAHIALLSRHSPNHDSRALTTAQMLVSVGLFTMIWPAAEPVRMPPEGVWFAILLTGLAASALAIFIQTAAQRHLSAARTAVILTTEPLFAGLFGYLLAGERLGPVQVVGGVLIIIAVYVAQRA